MLLCVGIAGLTGLGAVAKSDDGRESQPPRWELGKGFGVVWNVACDQNLPHSDHIEMSGRRVSVIVRYVVGADRHLSISRHVVWPMLRTIPNNTHASLSQDFGPEIAPDIRVDDKAVFGAKVVSISLDGLLNVSSVTDAGLGIERIIFPSRDKPAALERWTLRNKSDRPMRIAVNPTERSITTDPKTGVQGSYLLQTVTVGHGQATLVPGDEFRFGVVISGRLPGEQPLDIRIEEEEQSRREFVSGLFESLKLETPDRVLNRAFDLAKLRAAESIFATKGGLMHGPGGGAYYAAIWANDQAEYSGPFFPFLGDQGGNESTLNCYRHFARFMKPDYKAVPSSIIAEGIDIWNGAGDRGDAAMIAYGASRYALTMGDRKIAEELWPSIEWCLEYCRRKTTLDGVIASDSDELEGRFPAGKANLSTSTLTYGGLRSAADLARALGKPESVAAEYDRRGGQLRAAMERYFGAKVEGFETYRYYDGNDVLRAWICLPLTMGIMERKAGTIAALFSPRLWTADGLATQAGEKTFWDRSTLYALRGVFFSGETDLALRYFTAYTNRRLLGEHVPYPVEAYPEGNQRHLSAESALYCRVMTEGLFGITPTGLNSFTCEPRLPSGWSNMALRSIKAFGRDFDIEVSRGGMGMRIAVRTSDGWHIEKTWDGKAEIRIEFGNAQERE